MKVKSKYKNGNVYFKNFCVIKVTEKFFAVYERIPYSSSHYEELLTSGNTLQFACKKAKLLQIGYDICKNNML